MLSFAFQSSSAGSVFLPNSAFRPMAGMAEQVEWTFGLVPKYTGHTDSGDVVGRVEELTNAYGQKIIRCKTPRTRMPASAPLIAGPAKAEKRLPAVTSTATPTGSRVLIVNPAILLRSVAVIR